MEKYHGHLYNWYDTQSLSPLWPKYISTVDSGNLAGHLMTLRQGLFHMPHRKIVNPRLTEGLQDTLRVLADSLAATKTKRGTDKEKKITALINSLKAEIKIHGKTETPKLSLTEVKHYLERVQSMFASLSQEEYSIISESNEDSTSDEYSWQGALSKQIQRSIDELKLLAPWLFLKPSPEKFKGVLAVNYVPSLQELSYIDVTTEPLLASFLTTGISDAEKEWLTEFSNSLKEASTHAKERIATLDRLAAQCDELADIELDFLYDKAKQLLTIGYNAEEHRADAGYYDLLASEARLTTFVGIAQGKLPQEKLVRSWAIAHQCRRKTHLIILERLHV